MPARHLIRAFFVCLPLVAGCSSLQDLDLPAAPRAEVENSATPTAAPSTRTIAVYLGQRSYDDFIDPFDDQPAFGVEYSTQSTGSAVGWEIGFQVAQEDDDVFVGTNLEFTSTEFYGGIRKTFNQESNFRPYVGGGLSILNAEAEVSDVFLGSDSVDDTVLGIYLHAGIAYSITQTFAIGLDYRIFRADDADWDGVDIEVDYDQFALTLGFSF